MKLNLTKEQEMEICAIIGDWYLMWKKKITVEPGAEHRLGYAKEILKELICNWDELQND